MDNTQSYKDELSIQQIGLFYIQILRFRRLFCIVNFYGMQKLYVRYENCIICSMGGTHHNVISSEYTILKIVIAQIF